LSVPGCSRRAEIDPTRKAWRDPSGDDDRSPLSRSACASGPGIRGSWHERASSAGTFASSVAGSSFDARGVGNLPPPGAEPKSPEACAARDRTRTEPRKYSRAVPGHPRGEPEAARRRPVRPVGTPTGIIRTIDMSPLRGSAPVAIITAVQPTRAPDDGWPREQHRCPPLPQGRARPRSEQFRNGVRFFPRRRGDGRGAVPDCFHTCGRRCGQRAFGQVASVARARFVCLDRRAAPLLPAPAWG
jgi:hypothetical protein